MPLRQRLKALTKEPSRARAMTTILPQQSDEKRAAGETFTLDDCPLAA